MQSTVKGADTRLRRMTALAPIMALLLSGCGLNLAMLPDTDAPYRAELTKWQQDQLLIAPLGAMPQEVADGLPDEYVADASRFLTRTLETAPDGQRRSWRSIDRKTALGIRPISTSSNEDGICRHAVLSLETAESSRDIDLQACRLKNGTWIR